MNAETRRCKHCGKTLIQASYWYCPEEVVYTPNMAAPANNPYVYPVYATGYPTEAYGMVFPTVNAANAAAPSVPKFMCVHEPAEPDANKG